MKHKFTTTKGWLKSSIPPLIIIFILIIFYSSCKKLEENFDFSKVVKPAWNPEFAVPLVNSTLFISDFLEDSSNLNIITGPDQSLTFVYSGDSLISSTAGTFINLPDQNFEYPLDFDLPPLPPGFFDTINFVETYTFTTEKESQRIDSIFLSEGFLSISGQTNLNRDKASLRFKVLDIKYIETGAPLEIIAKLDNPDGQSDWVYFDTIYDLSQYKITLNDFQDTLTNTLTYFFDVIIEGDDNPDLSPYTVELTGSLTDLEFDRAFGYFSTYEVNFNDSLNIGIFEDAISGGINIGEGSVKLAFDLRNSFGLPVRFETNELYAYSRVTSPNVVNIELFGPGIPNLFEIQSPDITQLGQFVQSRLDFTQANFAEAFNIGPQSLVYNLTGKTNFDEDTTAQNFILNDSRIVLDVDLEFELFGSIANFTVEDTIALNFDENPKEVDYVMFRLNVNNGFPIDAHAQVYFADNNYQVLDSLLNDDNRIFAGALVGGAPDYRVTEPAGKITDILVDRPRLNIILDAKYLLFRTSLSTTDQDLIKIYDDYNIGLKIGTIAGLTVDTEN